MAQYDLHLMQNTAGAGTEFTERIVNLAKGAILSAAADGVPTVLAAGTDGYMLVRDNNEATGLKWIAIASGHTQNTDTGTTNSQFTIDSDSVLGQIIVKAVAGASNYSLTLQNTALTGNRTIDFPNASGTVALTSQLPNDPLTFKGAIDCSSNPNYPAADAGDFYKVSVAGKIGGASGINVEVGDSMYCTVDSTASGTQAGVGANWVVVQANIDGAVIGPASVGDGYLVLFDGTTGKLIKAGTGAPGTMAYETATNYVAKSLYDAYSILYADSDNTPTPLTVSASTIVGRKSSGGIAAMSPAEAMNVLWVSPPATKTSTGISGQIAKDTNYFYICTGTDVWKRSMLATNW